METQNIIIVFTKTLTLQFQ